MYFRFGTILFSIVFCRFVVLTIFSFPVKQNGRITSAKKIQSFLVSLQKLSYFFNTAFHPDVPSVNFHNYVVRSTSSVLVGLQILGYASALYLFNASFKFLSVSCLSTEYDPKLFTYCAIFEAPASQTISILNRFGS